MKKTICLLILTIVIIFSNYTAAFADNIQLDGEAAVLIDGLTGEILYQKNMDKQMYPASTTKIMTALLTIENTNLDDIVVIDSETPFTEGSRIYLIEDEKFTIEQLLYALMLESANDAAVALAKYISGNIEDFAELMNQKAEELGAKNTHFNNPNGLPDENHYTSAYDLAMIARYAMKNEKFRRFVSTASYQIPPTEKQEETRYLYNSNRFLWDNNRTILYKGKHTKIKYDKVTGIKTGYTDVARNCLVSAAKDGDREVIAVVLKSNGLNCFLDSRKLLDYGLDNYKNINSVTKNDVVTTVDISNGEIEKLDLIAEASLVKTVPKNINISDIKSKTKLLEEIKAPINKGEQLGKVEYYLDNEFLGEVKLIAADSVEKNINSTVKDYVFAFLNKIKWIFISIVSIIILYIILAIRINIRRRNRRKLRQKKYGLKNEYVYRNIIK